MSIFFFATQVKIFLLVQFKLIFYCYLKIWVRLMELQTIL